MMLQLSKSLRAGAQQVPRQARGTYYVRKCGAIVAACALATIYIGEGRAVNKDDVAPADDWMGVLMSPDNMANHPVTGRAEFLSFIVEDLNDTYKWSRERIADWLESIGF